MQYDVVLTRVQNNGYTARPLLWPKVVVTGHSEEDALANIQAKIAELQLQVDSKIVQVDVPEPDEDVPEPDEIEDSEFAEHERKMEQEERAYQGMLPILREKHLGEFVAVFRGELIDHDSDDLKLFSRINKQYPDDIVLMTKVYAGPEPVLKVRSPRLLKDAL